MRPLGAKLSARRRDSGRFGRSGRSSSNAGRSPSVRSPSLCSMVLAIPFFSLRLGAADQRTAPADSTTRIGFELIQEHFGKGLQLDPQPRRQRGRRRRPGVPREGREEARDRRERRRQASVAAAARDREARVRRLQVGHRPAGHRDRRPRQAHSARDLIPGLVEQAPTLNIYVYGETAVTIDFSDVLAAKMPYFFIAVVGLSFLLLMVAFRSLVIPATAAVMNLLAAAASFGVLVAIFQWGWLGELLGVGAGGPIEAFMPVLLLRDPVRALDGLPGVPRQPHPRGVGTHRRQRPLGQGRPGETGGIITAAGLIMITVFAGFALSEERVLADARHRARERRLPRRLHRPHHARARP